MATANNEKAQDKNNRCVDDKWSRNGKKYAKKLTKLFGSVPAKQALIPDQPRHNVRPKQLLDDMGKFQGQHEEIVSAFGSKSFNAQEFVVKHMAHLQARGFESAYKELSEFTQFVQSEIVDSVRNHNYQFVDLCETVQAVEPSLQRLHNMLNNSRMLLAQLRTLATSSATLATKSATKDDENSILSSVTGAPTGLDEEFMPLVHETWNNLQEQLGMAIAERQLHRAHKLLESIDSVLQKTLSHCNDLEDIDVTLPLLMWLQKNQYKVKQSRKEVVSLLCASIQERGQAVLEIQQHVRLLSKVATPQHALSSLLAAHEMEMDISLQQSLNPHTENAGEDGFEMAGAIAQRIFGTIGQAANNMTYIFRKEAHEMSATLTVWSLRLTERCVVLLNQHVLTPFAAPLGIAATMECVMQVLVYCTCLEDTHSLCLRPHLMRVLWPHVTTVLDHHVKMAKVRVKQAAVDDVNQIVSSGGCSACTGKTLACADVLAQEICSLIDEVTCTESVEVGYGIRVAVVAMFQAMCEGLVSAIQKCKTQQGRLPRILAKKATDILDSLAFTIEEELPKRTATATTKLGRLCRKSMLDEHLGPVAYALGLEEN